VKLLHEAQQQQPYMTLHPPLQHQQQQATKPPEPKALRWAERNPWFGTDLQMTALAYQVHDDLVGKQGADPASDAYYSALESQVQHAFPEKWAMHSVQVQQHAQQQRQQHHQWHQASNERVAGMPRRAHNSHHTRPAFIGAGLKVRLKDPVPTAPAAPKTQPSPAGTRLGIFQPMWHLANSNSNSITSNKGIDIGNRSQPCQQQGDETEVSWGQHDSSRLQQMQQAHHQQHPVNQQQQQQQQQEQQIRSQMYTDNKGSGGQGSLHAEPPEHSALAQAAANWSSSPGGESVGHADSGSSRTGTPDACSQSAWEPRPRPPQKVFPLHARSSRASGTSQRMQPSVIGAQSILNSNMSLEDMQKEYLRQRAAVLEELQRAKAQAEEDRCKLLKRIGRQFGKSRWIQ